MDSRKRSGNESGLSGNGGLKKLKQEKESLSTGVASKSKPCTKFFSTAGCPFGEGCHFLHFVPGGYNAVAQMMNLTTIVPQPSRNMGMPPTLAQTNGSSQSSVKTRMCNKYNTAEGCKYGDKCHFAHGEWELGKPITPAADDPRGIGMPSIGRPMPPRPGVSTFGGDYGNPAASFGAVATAKISVDASLAGAIIGKGGVNSKQIYRQTGAKFIITDHESDPNLKNIELEGTFEQIDRASTMVRELITNVGAMGRTAKGGPGALPGNNFKTKLCDNFAKGSCTFGDRCHFAHGAAELRKTVV
ncbi:hypothetical protein SAY87_008080 [Trapa incisa]|uniref:C3H1-type domain-containing protein n=2 Tax=Trapa TaxID=22665 RepID=A0AAN7L3A0_TRANT|nr:hypothetical protein SAY87_008080 [Trapa incisa]KAK4776949.1 hypothetical protein SAY86_005637 [Trapa natans]